MRLENIRIPSDAFVEDYKRKKQENSVFNQAWEGAADSKNPLIDAFFRFLDDGTINPSGENTVGDTILPSTAAEIWRAFGDSLDGAVPLQDDIDETSRPQD